MQLLYLEHVMNPWSEGKCFISLILFSTHPTDTLFRKFQFLNFAGTSPAVFSLYDKIVSFAHCSRSHEKVARATLPQSEGWRPLRLSNNIFYEAMGRQRYLYPTWRMRFPFIIKPLTVSSKGAWVQCAIICTWHAHISIETYADKISVICSVVNLAT